MTCRTCKAIVIRANKLVQYLRGTKPEEDRTDREALERIAFCQMVRDRHIGNGQ